MRQVIPGASNNLLHLHTDHLGSNSVMSYSSNGGMVAGSRTRYLPFGSYRTQPTQTYTDMGYTSQKHNDDVGLIYYNARYYLPGVGRFVSADSIVPDAGNPQSFNRYAYALNNPVRYRDQSGHCVDGITTWACIAAGMAVVTKVIDYGMTAWDTYQASRTLADPTASGSAKMMAGLTVGLSIIFEAIEPDDILPIGLPADDVARRAILNGAEEALEEGGSEALEGFLRDQLGDHADDAIGKMDELLGLDPDSLYNATQVASGKQDFTAAGHALQKHANRQGDIWAQYLPEGTLNPANYNAWASELVQDVLTDPGMVRSYHKDYLHYFAPDGRGLRFNLDGSFVGFINP